MDKFDKIDGEKLLLSALDNAIKRVEPFKIINNFIKLDKDNLNKNNFDKNNFNNDNLDNDNFDKNNLDNNNLNNDNLNNDSLIIELESKTIKCNLNLFDKIYVFGIGKAAFNMGYAIEKILGNRITKGVIVTKYGHIDKNIKLKRFTVIEAGHPVPDKNSVFGAKTIYEIAEKADKKTLIINLISGGGSALFTLPEDGISLEDMQKTTKILLECGATITEINSIRKHLSKVKGGKFAKICYPAKIINIILSDVIGDRLDSIASGISVADNTNFNFVYQVIKKYAIEDKLPENVLKIIKDGLAGKIEDTPEQGDKIFENVENILLGNNFAAVKAAKTYLEEKGINSFLLTSHLSGEAKDIAKFFSSIAIDGIKDNLDFKKPVAFIAGGETTVTIKGNGKGGRNLEMVLAFLVDLIKYNDLSEYKDKIRNEIFFLSAGTDGTDGPTDAAGAIFSGKILDKMEKYKLDPVKYLENNDSYNFFDKCQGLIKTGPTNTNVCDIQILLIK